MNCCIAPQAPNYICAIEQRHQLVINPSERETLQNLIDYLIDRSIKESERKSGSRCVPLDKLLESERIMPSFVHHVASPLTHTRGGVTCSKYRTQRAISALKNLLEGGSTHAPNS